MSRFEQLLERIEYKDLCWRLEQDPGGRWWLQVAATPHFTSMRGRKWFLSEHMTDSEFVATAFKACLTWEEHECREAFRYRGQLVFGPHMNVDKLSDLLAQNPDLTDRRDPEV